MSRSTAADRHAATVEGPWAPRPVRCAGTCGDDCDPDHLDAHGRCKGCAADVVERDEREAENADGFADLSSDGEWLARLADYADETMAQQERDLERQLTAGVYFGAVRAVAGINNELEIAL